MYLKDAFEEAFITRKSWREGSGAGAARINADHVIRYLGAYTQVEDIVSRHFAEITKLALAEGKSAGTVNRITSALSTLLTELRQNGYKLDEVKYKRQSETKGRPEFYREEEMELILAEAAKHDDFMLLHDSITFALKTGCRRGEMLGLTIEHLDFDRRTIYFPHTKAGRDHIIKMHEDLVPILERRVVQRIDERIFPWESGDSLLSTFKQVMNDAGVKPGRVWHTIRHTTATWLCERGAPLRSVMGVLNHSNVETTLRYAKASDKSIAAAIDLL